jgi:Fe-S cluster assembly protein SufD
MSTFVRSQLDAADAMVQGAPDWLAAARRAACEDVARNGLPGPRDEAWKYTSLRALEARAPRVGDADAAVREVDLAALELPGLDGPRVVFVNGAFRADLSRLADLPAGLTVAPLAHLLIAGRDDARVAFDEPFAEPGAAMARLNTALAADGPWIEIADGAAIEAPIHLVFAGADAGADIAWHLRGVIRVGAGASATVVEQHLGAAGAMQLGNLVEQVWLAPGAQLKHLRLQEAALETTLVSRTDVRVADDAVFETTALELGAGLARRDVRVRLEGTGARLSARGATALRGRQHSDAQFEVRHIARDAVSDVRWRGIADQRARTVFGGAIVVESGADGSDASLSNKNLLLSPHAEIDTRPVLEIHADEVKAAHGATVGKLDEQALFYLRSRGLPAELTRTLLTFAFCADVLDAIAFEPLRAALGERLSRRLPGIRGEAG